jgi:hypothetical protein
MSVHQLFRVLIILIGLIGAPLLLSSCGTSMNTSSQEEDSGYGGYGGRGGGHGGGGHGGGH